MLNPKQVRVMAAYFDASERLADAKYLALCREFVMLRKQKARRSFRTKRRNCIKLRGWVKLGCGWYGEAWRHADYPKLVLKISGPAGFGTGEQYTDLPDPDAWPVFAELCAASPAPHLPKIYFFERVSQSIAWAVMPKYDKALGWDYSQQRFAWESWLNGAAGAPSWLWPVINLRGAFDMRVDLHAGNAMVDPDTKLLIMTDPFSSR